MKMRWLNKLYALFCGYFWLPCPLCGSYFGGHEATGKGIMISWDRSEGICPDCIDETKKYNEEWMKNNPRPGYYL